MDYAFTPSSTRVLDYALELTDSKSSDAWCFRVLLLGLLAEHECRAALMLAEKGVDVRALRDRWPMLADDEARDERGPTDRPPWDVALRAVILAAETLLIDFPRPVDIPTEVLLYGLVAGDHELSAWLVERGFVPETLRTEILQLHGYGSGPLDCDELSIDMPPDTGPPDIAEPPDVGPPNTEPAGATTIPDEPPEPKRTVPTRPAYVPLTGDAGVLRVLDASANRAREGLRVVEDYVRFVLDDAHLTAQLKQLRHRLAAALGAIEGPERYACRDTQGDVGTVLTTPSERSRADVDAVLTAAFKRLGESLRSLEEFGKTLDAGIADAGFAATVEQIRYESYTLEAAVHGTRHSLKRLAAARLYVLIDGGQSDATFAKQVDELVRAGVDVIQLRDKQLSDRELVARARVLCAATAESKTLAIVNDRPDIAAVVGADGVHVGQDEMSVHEARSIVGPAALVGVSTHSLDDARRAVLDGASYIGVGPTFASQTKTFKQFPGVKLVAEVAAEIRLPAFAIGGITTENAHEVLATGIHGVAVSAAVTRASDPAAAVTQLRAILAED